MPGSRRWRFTSPATLLVRICLSICAARHFRSASGGSCCVCRRACRKLCRTRRGHRRAEGGSRAAASACAANRIAVLVPCHRVLRGDGGLGGYRWGISRKRVLLDQERRRRSLMNSERFAPMLDAIATLEPAAIEGSLDRDGFALTAPLIDADACANLARLYTSDEAAFRATVSMARHGFGSGEYKYFARPVPPLVAALRRSLYQRLAPVANSWDVRWGRPAGWPPDHDSLVARCRAAGQTRPTPLLLRYGPGDYNCLHQDLYGQIHFPLQAILLLDRPGVDFDGGELDSRRTASAASVRRRSCCRSCRERLR